MENKMKEKFEEMFHEYVHGQIMNGNFLDYCLVDNKFCLAYEVFPIKDYKATMLIEKNDLKKQTWIVFDQIYQWLQDYKYVKNKLALDVLIDQTTTTTEKLSIASLNAAKKKIGNPSCLMVSSKNLRLAQEIADEKIKVIHEPWLDTPDTDSLWFLFDSNQKPMVFNIVEDSKPNINSLDSLFSLSIEGKFSIGVVDKDFVYVGGKKGKAND